jgi:hypothetical protein
MQQINPHPKGDALAADKSPTVNHLSVCEDLSDPFKQVQPSEEQPCCLSPAIQVFRMVPSTTYLEWRQL